MAACQTCITLSHSGHALGHIEEEAERQKIEMKSMIETQWRDLQEKLTSVSNSMKTTRRSYNEAKR